MGGMGIRDPVSMASLAFQASRSGTDHIIHALRGIEEFSMADHMMVLNKSRTASHMEQDKLDNVLLEGVLSSLNERMRSILCAIDGRTSCWLTTLPLSHYHFNLSPVEFRDALSLRYGKCPRAFHASAMVATLQHFLDCKRGVLVIQRHNEIRESLGDLCAHSFPSVVREPIVHEADESHNVTLW